jgi:Leucine-rich repeat (LRR) protein
MSILDLKELPPEIFTFTDLTEFDLSDNQITSIPKTMGQLSNLEWLYLSNNQITSTRNDGTTVGVAELRYDLWGQGMFWLTDLPRQERD